MSLRQKIFGWAARKSAEIAGGASWGGISAADLSRLFGTSTYTGKSVDVDSAMTMSANWSCVRILAESIGMLPWAVYEKGKNGNATKVDHQLSTILVESPNADMTSVELKEAQVANLALAGNTYSLRENRNDRSVSALYPLVSNNVVPQRSSEGTISYKVLERGKWVVYPQEKIWHVKGFGSNGLVGFAPVTMMRQAIGLGLALEEFNARFFANGARTNGVVKIPDWLKDDQRARAKKILAETYGGMENAHKMMLLEGGMEYTATTMALEDAQFLESRNFSIDEICRIYRIPPHMVAKLDRATFSNIEQMSIEFAIYTLQPYLKRIEVSADKWLLTPKDRGRFFVKFNLDALLRGDTAARGAFYTQMLQNGVYNRNEVRALENMNRVDGQDMDVYTVQSNMAPIEALASLIAAQSAAKPPADPAKSADVSTHINMALPDSVKHHIAQSVELKGVAELAQAVANGHELSRQDSKKLAESITDLMALMKAPREALYDEKGNVVGSRITESIH